MDDTEPTLCHSAPPQIVHFLIDLGPPPSDSAPDAMQLNDANSQEGEAVVGSVAHAFSFLFFFSDLTGSICSSTRFRFLEPSTSPLAEAAAAFSLAFFAFLISFFEIATGLPM